MAVEQAAPQPEKPATEPLSSQLTFRATDSEKNDVRVIAFFDDLTESDVLRSVIDLSALRVRADAIRALRKVNESAGADAA